MNVIQYKEHVHNHFFTFLFLTMGTYLFCLLRFSIYISQSPIPMAALTRKLYRG